MSLDLHALLACVVIPAAIALLASWIAWRLDRREGAGSSGSEKPPQATRVLSSLVLATGWWLAVTIGVLGAEEPALWPDDGWPKIIWPMLASVLLVAPLWNTSWGTTPGAWVVFAWIAIVAASLAMPLGDGWADMVPLHRNWMTAISIAATANALSLFWMAQRAAQRWLPLVILAGLACPAISGAASYSALFESCLAAIVATAVIASFAALGLIPSSAAIVFPSVLFMATMVAASRFRSYDDVPAVAYGLAFFAPSLIALADRLVAKRSPAVRIAVAAAAALLLVGATVYQFLVS
ncbi:MAG: hypothetical protein ACO1RT_18480 [Planctomycetaceae bacterium]